MKTVREVAEELNVSRQAIYSKLTDKFKKKFTILELRNNKEVLVISNDGVKQIIQGMDKVDNHVNSQSDSKVDNRLVELLNKNIEILQNQLEVKDQQIMELNLRLREAQELNKNNQVLLHREQEQPKMLKSKSKFSMKNLFGFKNK